MISNPRGHAVATGAARADSATHSGVPSRGARKRALRLLPTVVIVGGALLALKTSDLVHGAYAAADQAGAAQENADLTHAPKPSNPDYAGAQNDASVSAAEVDVLSSMAKRRRELDGRQSHLDTQAKILAAAEQRVDAKITQLKQLQARITALLGQRDEAQKAQIAALVKTYSSMKPKDAARIFNSLPDEVLVPVAQQMKADALGTILANMSADTAQKLTVKLASRLTLPETADMSAPVQTAQAVPAAQAPGAQTPAAKASAAPVRAEAKTQPSPPASKPGG
jgi:flagellar motility protein MotE (MotC chaperone)